MTRRLPLQFALGKLALIGLAATVANAADPRSISELLSRVAAGPLDPSIFFELESKRPEPRIFDALGAAFDKRESKEERQRIAVTMLRLGNRSERYFAFLSGYAQQAIEDRTPLYYVYGPAGDVVRGEMSYEFEKWCRENHRDTREVMQIQFVTYPQDVQLLGSAEDSRAAELLKRGLESQNPLVVYYSAEGLALLQDDATVPLVEQSCERFPAGTRRLVAGALAQ